MTEKQRPAIKAKAPRKTIRFAISAIAFALLLVHIILSLITNYRLPSDAMAIGLLIVAVLPWLFDLISEAEFPGGWKVKFREIKEEQVRQSNEIEWMKFLMRNFLTQFELQHLYKFAADEPFWFDYNSDSKFYFERELRRLIDLKLIERLPNTGIRMMLYNRDGIEKSDNKEAKDVKKYLRITQQGREYLKMHDEIDQTR